ncbi:MAM3 [Candida jiufengensis]|uniref:MAM3 n=1 Tax=Candida jiufengensis TaxID=497108 RepID=UPI002224D537|nr:MAM3 [Candida jiufengensis]KAI5952539.1 MAM3 [Candida jiufengensis]
MSKNKLSSLSQYGTTVSLNNKYKSSLSKTITTPTKFNSNIGSNGIGKILFIFSNFIKLVHSIPIYGRNEDIDVEKHHELTPKEFYINLFISMFLVLAGGVFAGLTLGLMGQDEVYLKVIATSGDKNERKHAKNVLKLIGRGKHWVLVTLLLSNVITNESLPIVLDRCLGGGWPAVVTSTVSIVIFGEIIPQSICVRYGLQVGSLFAPFVLILMYIMYPVAYPCALLLDHILGEDHGTVYKKSGLKTLVTLHKTMGVERLNQDEVTIISAVLDLKEKSVSSIMTPMDRVYTMSADTLLDEKTVEEIFNAGFSRIPIHLPNEPNNFIGMLLVRVLISYDPEDSLPVASFPLATLPETGTDTSCLNILNYFQEGKSHMIIVSETPGEPTGAIGVLTLEDVIEELIGEEIVDESDVYIDINKNIKRKQPGPLSKRNLTAYLHNLYQRGGATSKRNSLDSQINPPSDLRERLTRQGSQATVISSTPNTRRDNKSEHLTDPSTSVDQKNSTNANASKWKIKNPAMNPLETSKKFVTIKRPDQGTIDSVAKAASPAPPNLNEQDHEHHDVSNDSNLVGVVHPTEEGALNEAKKRSLDVKRDSSQPPRHNNTNNNNRFLLPDEKETDVSDQPNNTTTSNGNHHNKDSNSEDKHYNDGHYDVQISSRNIPIQKTNRDNEGLLIPEQQESRSYRTGGIIESVINVDGVHKTIIENVSDREDQDDDLILDGSISTSSKHHKKNKKKKRSSSTRSESFNMNDNLNFDDNEENKSLLSNNGSGDKSNSRNSSIGSNSSSKKKH